jgi:hypothetical protein
MIYIDIYVFLLIQDDNLVDVLELLVSLMSEHPQSMVPAFDRKQGVRYVLSISIWKAIWCYTFSISPVYEPIFIHGLHVKHFLMLLMRQKWKSVDCKDNNRGKNIKRRHFWFTFNHCSTEFNIMDLTGFDLESSIIRLRDFTIKTS